MKLSVSLSNADIEVIDGYAKSAGLNSRSAVIQHAVSLLKHPDLEDEYAAAWAEWDESGERDAWEITTGDGLTHAAG